MPEHVRLRDIAEKTGVSVATVSLALRRSPLISVATRERVETVARQLGYQAHPYVSAYMSWRRNPRALRRPSIALLHTYANEGGWRNYRSASVREMHAGALEQIRLRGYAVAEFRLGVMRPARLVSILQARGISGLVFAPIADFELNYELPWERFSGVQIGTGPAGLCLERVTHDHYHGALEAVRRCAEKGYRRPGLVVDPAHDARLQHVWRAGFEMGVGEHGFSRDTVLSMVETQPDPSALARWLKAKRPDVIVTNLHRLVEGLLVKLGHRIPGDLGLVSLSVPTAGDRYSGIEQSARRIGMHAVDLLASALQLNRTGLPAEQVTTLVAGRWNVGETF